MRPSIRARYRREACALSDDQRGLTPAFRVRNVLGVEEAAFPASGIVLIAGDNGAGKSSVLNAIGGVLTQGPKLRETGARAGWEKAMVRAGAERGAVTLRLGEATARVDYPDGALTMEGPPIGAGTPLAIGTVRFTELTPEQRLQETSRRLRAEPTAKDLRDFLLANPCSFSLADLRAELPAPVDGLPYEGNLFVDALVRRLFDRLADTSWDQLWQDVRERRTKLTGAWEQTAKEKFGSKKAAGWHPPNLDPAETYDTAALEAAAEEERTKLAGLRASMSLSAEQIAQLKEAAAKGDKAKETQLAHLEAEKRLETELREIVEKQNAVDAPVDYAALIECPSCHARLREKHLNNLAQADIYRVYEAVAVPSEEEQAVATKAARDMERRRLDVVNALETMRRERAGLQHQVQAGINAAARLQSVSEAPTAEPEEIAVQRKRTEEAVGLLDAVKRMREAADVYAQWTQIDMVVNALAPGGLRAAVLGGRIKEINTEIEKMAGVAGFRLAPALQVDGSILLRFIDAKEPRAWQLGSRSEQWRVDLLFQVAFARREKPLCIVVDELDKLAPQHRGGPLQLIQAAGLRAVVACTAREPSAVPDLGKLGLGQTYWIAAGKLKGESPDAN
jgi:energy-coupling factor transporter ATP-binding protein EcfA2